MLNKYLLVHFACFGCVWAEVPMGTFTQFENQVSIGYGVTQGTMINGTQNVSNYSTQFVNLEAEHLFDMGIWFDANYSMVTNYSQPNLGPLNGGDGSSEPFGQDPFLMGITAKAGYAFPFFEQQLQLIPYGMFGRTTNWATSTIIANGEQSLTTDYFYTGGFGGRVAYRINDVILLYADELYAYNWDNSGAIKSIQTAEENYGKSYAATNYTFTTTLGAKFNVSALIQLGINGFWNNFQPQSNIAGVMYTPLNTFGGMVSAGITY